MIVVNLESATAVILSGLLSISLVPAKYAVASVDYEGIPELSQGSVTDEGEQCKEPSAPSQSYCAISNNATVNADNALVDNDRLDSLAVSPAESDIEDGVYEIVPVGCDGKSISIAGGSLNQGANSIIDNYTSRASQKFVVSKERSGLFSIVSVHTGQALDVVNSSHDDGANVTQWPLTKTDNQLWSIAGNNDGSYMIESWCNGLFLSSGFGLASDNDVCVAAQGDAAIQSWLIVPAKTIDEKVSYVSLASGDSLVLDVCAGSSERGQNLTLWSSTCVRWQRFHPVYLKNGYYKLVADHSSQVLDVVASGQDLGTNVTQWDDTGAENQQWDIIDNGDGSYKIVSRCNGLPMVASFERAGANVQTGGGLDSSWRFISVPELPNSRTVGDGVYSIGNYAHPSYVFDVVAGSLENGANITLWSYYEAARQQYRFAYQGNGCYSITALHSGDAVDLAGSSGWPGANVSQWPYYGGDNQLWYVVPASDGAYSFVSKSSGLTVACDGPAADGSNIIMQTPDDSEAQKWQLSSISSDADIEDGTYLIASYENPDVVLDVVAGSYDEGTNITLWRKENPSWQRFKITKVGGGYYRVAPLHSGQAIDVVASGQSSGTNVTQWSYFETDNQLWKIKQNGDGSYSFISKCNGLALSVDGALEASTNVVVSSLNLADDCQKWSLFPCSVRDSFKLYIDAGHGWDSSYIGEYDPGACSFGLVENVLTNEVAEKIAKICQERYGLCVHLNTYGGQYWKRHPEAVRLSCSTFLSLHFNSGGGTGVESYIHSYNAAAGSAAWQEAIHPWLVTGTGLYDRGEKQAALAVCGGQLPSVLLELGFIDNVNDMSIYDANKAAEFIAAGIDKAASRQDCQS